MTRSDLPARHLLLVTHRPIQEAGGPAARWRSFVRYLPGHGWEVEILSPSGRSQREFAPSPADMRRALRRRRVMSKVGRAAEPVLGSIGLRPEAIPPSMGWAPVAAREVQRRLRTGRYAAVVATGPPMAALLAARLARRDGTPLVVELRDLWAGNPAFDRGSGVLARVEKWVLGEASAVVALTPEAVADLRRRHPELANRVVEIPNGFEPELLELRRKPSRNDRLTILHSGTLTPDRPLTPLLEVLEREPNRSAFRLVLHGYVDPAIRDEVENAAARIAVDVRAPSSWDEAVKAIAAADVGLITQARGAGDETAVAAKVYEYLAIGKPVLCLSDGGATEALLGRLAVDAFCARLGDRGSIGAALDRLRDEPLPPPLAPERLAKYDRPALAKRMAGTLDSLAEAHGAPTA